MEPCIFCKIASKQVDSKIVYEDENVVAFQDLNPQAAVHLLFVPKEHITSHLDLREGDAQLLSKIHEAINQVARRMCFDESGFRVVINVNDDGGQTVPHLHFHVLAGRRMTWPPG